MEILYNKYGYVVIKKGTKLYHSSNNNFITINNNILVFK
jgi:hypothetical protein